MPLIWNIGSIVGPALGGALANPLHRPTGDRSPGPFLWRFPYALPNLVAAGIFLVGVIFGMFFLEETHELKKHRRDIFLRAGDRAVRLSRNLWRRTKALATGQDLDVQVDEETEYAALPGSSEQFDEVDEERGNSSEGEKRESHEESKSPSIREVLTWDTIPFLIAYTSMAMHNTAFDQIISVFMHHSRSGAEIIPDGSWWRFNKGFGMGKSSIYFGS
jgi:MFS family permease